MTKDSNLGGSTQVSEAETAKIIEPDKHTHARHTNTQTYAHIFGRTDNQTNNYSLKS